MEGEIIMTVIKKKRKAIVEQSDCVACGCCVKVCPLGAIRIIKGIMAQVDENKCVGCGKCARECPASVIDIRARRSLPSVSTASCSLPRYLA